MHCGDMDRFRPGVGTSYNSGVAGSGPLGGPSSQPSSPSRPVQSTARAGLSGFGNARNVICHWPERKRF
jgi:hypothetical protein